MAAEAQSDVLTVEEAAKMLKVAPSTVCDYARAGKIPGRKIGVWRFSRAALLAWLGGREETTHG